MEQEVGLQCILTWGTRQQTLTHIPDWKLSSVTQLYCEITHLPQSHGRVLPTVLHTHHTEINNTDKQKEKNALICRDCPKGLKLSSDDLPWGNEELEGKREVSGRFTGFNSCYCHPERATGLWLSLRTTCHLTTTESFVNGSSGHNPAKKKRKSTSNPTPSACQREKHLNEPLKAPVWGYSALSLFFLDNNTT